MPSPRLITAAVAVVVVSSKRARAAAELLAASKTYKKTYAPTVVWEHSGARGAGGSVWTMGVRARLNGRRPVSLPLSW